VRLARRFRQARVLAATVLQVGVSLGMAGVCYALQRWVAVIDEEDREAKPAAPRRDRPA
jgi:hypothetical protein